MDAKRNGCSMTSSRRWKPIGRETVKLIEIYDYPFNRVEITWHGPFPWTKDMSYFAASEDLMKLPGIYRAESLGHNRRIIKYIGTASESFASRLNAQHRIKRELVDGQFRRVRMFLGTIELERRITFTKSSYVELEYILQNVHWQDLISWHGLATLPRTSRGEGWHIVNRGQRGPLRRVIAYPAFAVSGHDR
jgi:hypothetical protein